MFPRVCLGSPGRFHTFDLARQLDRLGHLSQIYTAYPKWKACDLPLDRVKTFPWFMVSALLLERCGLYGFKRRFQPYVKGTFDLWMKRRLIPCDVFHCLSSWGIETHRAAKRRYGAVTVCDRGSSHILYHDEILAAEYARWNLRYQPIDPWVIDRELQEYEESDFVFVPSTFAYRSFVEKGVAAEKLRTIPLGIDLKLFYPIPKKDNVFRVIYVGALSLQKGIPYLLEAVASIQLPRFEVWLIGGVLPEVKPFLARYEGRYQYMGRLPRTELFRYYSQGSVFVMPSIQDGFGMVQAQAMACGVPVIATTNTGAEDLFTDGKEGFIVPIRNAEKIQEKLIYLYENAQVRDEMGRAALNRVQELKGWDTYGHRVAVCYKEALNGQSKY